MTRKKTALVIGGTSGLGLELALRLRGSHEVIITGRQNPEKEGLLFEYLELSSSVEMHVDMLVRNLPQIDLLVYSAGFWEEAAIDRLTSGNIICMTNVGLLAPAMLLSKLLKRQHKLAGFIAITSNSQWEPNEGRPVYTAVKAGLGMLANSVSLDSKVDKVLVAAPAGMNTSSFWKHSERDTSTMLDPSEVASEILLQYGVSFRYELFKIHRINGGTGLRTEVADMR